MKQIFLSMINPPPNGAEYANLPDARQLRDACHDFNNYLAAILGNVELAKIECAENSPALEPLNAIESVARRAAELCNQLLASSAKEPIRPEPTPPNAPLTESGNKPLILIVDDDDTVRTTAVKLVTRLGYDAIGVRDGVESVEVFSAHNGPDAHLPRIDLVIMDLMMPRMNGNEALEKIRLIQPDIKAIISSGYSEKEISPKFANMQLDGFIQKPYQLIALRDMLKTALS